jgi:predicted AlkP superfamily phosphohydrolase/phosphomutase
MKLLIVGIDALDPLFLEEYACDLPTFKKLKQSCEWFTVKCDARIPNSCSGWLSLYSGLLGDEHGILEWHFDGEWLGLASKVTAFWEQMNAAGLSVGLLNPPLVWPAHIDNGWCVAGFPSPLHYKRQIEKSGEAIEQKGLYYPTDLAELAPLNYTVDASDYADGFLTDQDRDSWYMPRILELGRLRTKFALTLIEEKPVDVMFVVYTMIDRLLHAASYFLPHRKNLADVKAQIWNGYVEMDRFLGRLLKAANAEMLLICGDHGLNFSTNAPIVWGPENEIVTDDPYRLNHTWTTMGFARKEGTTMAGGGGSTDLRWLYRKALQFLGISSTMIPKGSGQEYSEEDEEVVKQKLRGLGYI